MRKKYKTHIAGFVLNDKKYWVSSQGFVLPDCVIIYLSEMICYHELR